MARLASPFVRPRAEEDGPAGAELLTCVDHQAGRTPRIVIDGSGPRVAVEIIPGVGC